jgi:hypothetical protein
MVQTPLKLKTTYLAAGLPGGPRLVWEWAMAAGRSFG